MKSGVIVLGVFFFLALVIFVATNVFDHMRILGYATDEKNEAKDGVPVADTPACQDSNGGVFSKLPGETRFTRWFGTFTFKTRCNSQTGIMTDYFCQGKSVVATHLPCPLCNKEGTACEGKEFTLPLEPLSLGSSGYASGSTDSYHLTLSSALERAEPGDTLSLGNSAKMLLLQKTSEQCSLFSLKNSLRKNPEHNVDVSQDSLIVLPRDNTGCSYDTFGIVQRDDTSSLWEFIDQRVDMLYQKYEKYCTKKIQNTKFQLSICDVPQIQESDLNNILNRERFESKDSGFGAGLKLTISFK